MNYEFHPDAEQEFIEEAAYYESEVPGLGSRFVDELNRVIELLRAKIQRAERLWTSTYVILF